MTDSIDRLRANITNVFLGKAEAVDRVICCLLAKGHLLIEDVPGVGKTVLATALARSIDCSFSRVQLSPDLLPSDILGVTVYNRDTSAFEFKPGPIFANIVLADEINRTPPRTQTALLEAMNERTVTVDGHPHHLPAPFMLIATQNPHDFEGTYLLPENQLDRFLMRIGLGYPDPRDEARVLDLRPADTALRSLEPVMSEAELLDLQARVDDVRMDTSLVDFIIALASETRTRDEFHVGISPRGALAVAQAARATAILAGRDYTIPEDVISNILPVCAHRVITRARAGDNGSAHHAGAEAERILLSVLETIESPA